MIEEIFVLLFRPTLEAEKLCLTENFYSQFSQIDMFIVQSSEWSH